jgi:hypothetical protein
MTLTSFIHSVLEFQSAVQLGSTPESLMLEFKAKIDGWNAPAGNVRKKAQKETCRDIAQFANTLGGCLIVGVSGRLDPTRGVNVADAVVSIKKPEQLWQWIEQAIVNYLVPSTFNHDITPISLPGGNNIIAVNVPASRYLVSLWDRTERTIEYVRRTSHGKDWMNPDEMERHLMDGSRAGKLTLIAAKGHTPSDRVEIASGIWLRYENANPSDQRWMPPGFITIGQMSEYWFELHMQNDQQRPCSVTIPYSFIREAWVGTSGLIMLLLAVRVIVRYGRDEVTLEPYV